MLNQVFEITGNKIASMVAGETALLFSSQDFDSTADFQAAWDKKLSLATKVEAKYGAIKSVHKDDDSAEVLIKYKTVLGIPTNCEFSFINAADYDTFFAFLQKDRYFTRQHDKLTPLKAILNYLIGIAALLAFTAFCYSEALKIANGTVEEATNGKQELFNRVVGYLGDKGVLVVGGVGLCYLVYKAWMRFANPPTRLLFLPPAA